MSEEPILFGPDANLIGVLSRPVGVPLADVACLMINVGVTHRVGPHRINVKLARHLARRGMASLRFDLSGIGDSAPARRAAEFRVQAVQDLQAAMDRLQAMTGVQRFVIFGICSGAMHAHSTALADARVVGLFMFDGYTYTTPRVRRARNWHRLMAMPRNPAIAGKTWRWLQRLLQRDATPEVDIFASDDGVYPTAIEFADSLLRLHERGTATFLVYSGTLHAVDRGTDQLASVAGHPALRCVRYEFMADVDHTLLPVAGQRRVVDAFSDWALGLRQDLNGRPAQGTAAVAAAASGDGARLASHGQ